MDVAHCEGKTPLVVQSEADFSNRNVWLSPNLPYIPAPILSYWMQAEVATASHNVRIWQLVHDQSDVPTILELAPLLSLPSLVIWCESDRVFHVSGAVLLDQALPFSKRVVLDKCGHVPMLDRPDAVAEHYIEFLHGLESSH